MAWPLLANWQLRLCVNVCSRKLQGTSLNCITHCITVYSCLFGVTLCFTVLGLRCHMKGWVVSGSSEEWRNATLISLLSSSCTPSFLGCVENIAHESEFCEWHSIASFIRRPAAIHTLTWSALTDSCSEFTKKSYWEPRKVGVLVSSDIYDENELYMRVHCMSGKT